MESVLEIIDRVFISIDIFMLEESQKSFFIFIELTFGFGLLVHFGPSFFDLLYWRWSNIVLIFLFFLICNIILVVVI